MRLLLIPALLLRLGAQEPAPARGAQPAVSQEPSGIVPGAESALTGSIEIGYRARTGVGGNLDSYRSVVNLGEGPKMLGAEFTVLDPKKRLFDRVEVRGYNWGDDPYTTLHVSASKERRYDLGVDYRNIAYFNSLPSFANPALERGVLFNQRAYDMQRRLASLRLDLLPGTWIIPYLAYDRNSGYGAGITTFVSDGNEYPVLNRIRDGTANYRGGIRIELRRAHLTLEQGGTTFKDDQQVFSGAGGNNPGNRGTPFLGQDLFLSSLLESYGIRGSSIYSRGLFTASPASWLDAYGQFLYSQPSDDVSFQQFNTGSFVQANEALFFTGQQFLLSAAAKLPRISGSFGVEVRPVRRLRILQSWLTDRLHVASSTQGQQTLTQATSLVASALRQSAFLVTNYSQEQILLLFTVVPKLTVRGGYRFVWGNASDVVLPPAGLGGADAGRLRRHIGLAGVTFRPSQKLHLSGEVETASSSRTYFRTSLRDYQRMHARVRYQALGSLLLSADFSLLNNQNPLPSIRYDYLFRRNSLAAHWTPQGGKRFSMQADYTRSTLKSDLSYLAPQILAPERSFYRDNAHLSSALVDLALPGVRGLVPKLALGGSLLVSSGSRPTEYFQPLAKVSVPISKNVSWVSQWRYYGFGESLYQFEGFRTHLITSGLRISR
ncbi:MAG: hypothetical protein LC130_26925 [Bryobacterales bacterium]|nr:hypothetical protein [Bryobacterales bacterium]